MSLSTLPDLCLVNIFHRVPVYDLLATVTLVCHRWRSIQPTACFQRRSLFVMDQHLPVFHNQYHKYLDIYRELVNEEDGSKWLGMKTQNNFSIVRKKLSKTFCSKMIQSFIRVTNLKIYYTQTNILQIGLVNLLLKKLSPNLHTLKVVFRTDRTRVLEFTATELFHCCSSLFESINSQKNLQILHLDIDLNRYHRDLGKLSVDLPQLTELSYNFWDQSASIRESRQMPKQLEILNANIEKTRLENLIYDDETTVPEMLSLDPRLAIRVTKLLVIVVESTHLPQFELFYSQFSSLLSLKLCLVTSITLNQIVHGIDKLTQLLHFAVFVNFSTRTIGDIEDSSEALPVLNSVKVLTFDFVIQFHNQPIQFLKSIASLCPNVQVIVWQHRLDKCTECGYDFSKCTNRNMQMFDIVPQHQFDQCLRQTFKPMKRFERLCNVELQIYYLFNLFNANLKINLSRKDFLERFG